MCQQRRLVNLSQLLKSKFIKSMVWKISVIKCVLNTINTNNMNIQCIVHHRL
ncbi:unnamed protein product [Paramecium octaurelia]|uniref:Uncharacterized protein n=1 Tax=Paramecium octaurelia TaxID=43137 RepID=A0A8S1V678_PAROT|nr:unnamed protein product [Paramecium octaurelia]